MVECAGVAGTENTDEGIRGQSMAECWGRRRWPNVSGGVWCHVGFLVRFGCGIWEMI